MELIADTNIVIAALLRPGVTRNLLFNSRLVLYAPDYLSEELKMHEKELLEKSGLGPEPYGKALSAVLSNVVEIRKAGYAEFENRARAVSPDPDDWRFFALALAKKCAIWSNDKRLKNQDACKVYDTARLLELLGKR